MSGSIASGAVVETIEQAERRAIRLPHTRRMHALVRKTTVARDEYAAQMLARKRRQLQMELRMYDALV